MSKPWIGKHNAIAFDPSFIHKSGKHTPVIGYFWSGCAVRAIRGIEILLLYLIDADTRLSFHLEAVQTPSPNCLSDNELTLIDWYAVLIKKQIKLILSITCYVVADAYFSKKNFVEKIMGCSLRLVSKLWEDSDFSYFSIQPKTGKIGRPAKYGRKDDVTNLNPEHFTLVENQKGIMTYSSIVYSKSLERNLLLVVELFQLKVKTIYRLLFSTDTMQAPIDVIDIYHTRFQIEFGFRDAKQFAGLKNSHARSGNKLIFHFNTALTTVNIDKVMQLKNLQTRENSFSMATYKILFHNTLMLSRFFAYLLLTRTQSKIVNMSMNYCISSLWPLNYLSLFERTIEFISTVKSYFLNILVEFYNLKNIFF
ncbi:mobile element protein [Aquipluma nitroreducens]|uniref:Mobile element protein n=1 Tax=Aquipluma nitroreducens TaxID=2010828 RepID=A0A5K7SF98_9BACT|nr:transposase [Aquipluma nitroreducens]BBE20270.1 mobile element protein [Aquipluma nitroreducens]